MTLRRNISYECRLTASHLPCPAFLATPEHHRWAFDYEPKSLDWLTLVLTRGYCHELSLHVTHFLFIFHFYVTPLGLPHRFMDYLFHQIFLLYFIIPTYVNLDSDLLLLFITDRIIITPYDALSSHWLIIGWYDPRLYSPLRLHSHSCIAVYKTLCNMVESASLELVYSP